jgi:hypothetical protein
LIGAIIFYGLIVLGIVSTIAAVIIVCLAVIRFLFGQLDDWIEDGVLLAPLILVLFNLIITIVSVFIGAILSGIIGSISFDIPEWLIDYVLVPLLLINAVILGLYIAVGLVLGTIAVFVHFSRWILESVAQRVLLRRLLLYGSTIAVYGITIAIISSIFIGALVTVLVVLAVLLKLNVTESNIAIDVHNQASGSITALGHTLDSLYRLIADTAPVVTIFAVATFAVAIALRRRIPWNGDRRRAQPFVSIITDAGRHVADIALRAAKRSTGGRNDRPVFHGSQRRAEEAITERREFIGRRSREYLGSRQPVEILEIPPPLSRSIELRNLSEEAADATLVRLVYQRDGQALLFDRVVDAIVCFARARQPSLVSGTEILLRSLHWWERLQGEYGWVALIRTDHPDEIAQFLTSIRDWLGIGVRVARPAGWAHQKRCMYSGDLGTVAGRLMTRDFQTSYYLTCAHVVPKSCVQVRLTRETAKQTGEPDAALLRDHECVQQRTSFARVRFVTRRVLTDIGAQRMPVERVGGHSRKVTGYVKNDQATYWTKDGDHERFPACIVQTKRTRYVWGLLPLPLSRHRFSSPGDSGSWVLARRNGDARQVWLGMVAAGGEGDVKMESYVVKSAPLLLYLRRRLRNESPFIPYAMEEL